MLDYWIYTNDTTYNDLIQAGILYQVGDSWDFMPQNQTNGMGNDDQGKISSIIIQLLIPVEVSGV